MGARVITSTQLKGVRCFRGGRDASQTAARSASSAFFVDRLPLTLTGGSARISISARRPDPSKLAWQGFQQSKHQLVGRARSVWSESHSLATSLPTRTTDRSGSTSSLTQLPSTYKQTAASSVQRLHHACSPHHDRHVASLARPGRRRGSLCRSPASVSKASSCSAAAVSEVTTVRLLGEPRRLPSLRSDPQAFDSARRLGTRAREPSTARTAPIWSTPSRPWLARRASACSVHVLRGTTACGRARPWHQAPSFFMEWRGGRSPDELCRPGSVATASTERRLCGQDPRWHRSLPDLPLSRQPVARR